MMKDITKDSGVEAYQWAPTTYRETNLIEQRLRWYFTIPPVQRARVDKLVKELWKFGVPPHQVLELIGPKGI